MGSIGRLAVAALLLAVPLLVAAQAFPSRPITLICPWPAGGTTDAHLRKFAEVAQKYLGHLVDYAKANSGKLSYGRPGTGTSPHLLMEEVGMKTGVQVLHVPFKGNADSMQALLGGHVLAQSDSTGWGRFVDAGTLRLLVTFGEKRTRENAPTEKELGFDIVSYSPYGLVGPKGMDAQVVKALHDAFKKTLDDPEHLKLLQQLDQVYWYKSSREYAQWAAQTLQAERATIERVGLLGK